MPRIRMRTTAAGPTFSRLAGRIYTVTDAEAKAYLDARCAELIGADGEVLPAPAPETAAEEPEENAAERSGRTRPRTRG